MGDVTASIDGDELVVRYVASAPWSLAETKLDIEDDWRLIPQTKSGQPIPGHFAFKQSHGPSTREVVYRRALSRGLGPTLYIAAHAEVRGSGQGAGGGAWAAGTRFAGKGGWATYFAFTPQVIDEIEQGPGWLLTRVSGTVTGTGTVVDQNLYMIYDAEGVANAPLPQIVRDDLSSASSPGKNFFIVDQHAVDEIAHSLAQGKLTPELAALAAARPGGGEGLVDCSDEMHAFGPPFQATIQSFDKSFDLAGALQGQLAFSGTLQVNATTELDAKVLKVGIDLGPLGRVCLPYGTKAVDVHARGTITLASQSKIAGSLAYTGTWSTDVYKPTIKEVIIMAGYVPIVFRLTLPITVGIDISAAVAAQAEYTGAEALEGTFDYRCSLGLECTGSVNFSKNDQSAVPVSFGISGRAQLSPWVQGALRLTLYTDGIAYGQIGFRPALEGDLWGYQGNACGDADGDGVPETVSALTLDVDGQAFVTAAASLGGFVKEWNDVWHTDRHHFQFRNLEGSGAMSPIVLGPPSASPSIAQEYGARMRPCWPYMDSVHYVADWGDNTNSGMDSPAQIPGSASHAWRTAGQFPLNVTATQDAHGRTLSQATIRLITVSPLREPCPDGRADCDGDPSNGCEVALATDVANCGICGNICPGSGFSTSDAACVSSACTMSCRGDHYDVDRNPATGCEAMDGIVPVHMFDPSIMEGPFSCNDGASTWSVQGEIVSDGRTHSNPAVASFDPASGSAPDVWAIGASGGPCFNDLDATFTTSGGSTAGLCYRFHVITSDLDQVLFTSGNGSVTFSSGIGSYNDNTIVLFIVDKVCSTEVQENVDYRIDFHL